MLKEKEDWIKAWRNTEDLTNEHVKMVIIFSEKLSNWYHIVWFPLTSTYEVSSVAEFGFRRYPEISLWGRDGRGKKLW